MPRPINVRNVSTSGTNGVGEGTEGVEACLWKHRTHFLPMARGLMSREDKRNELRIVIIGRVDLFQYL